MGGRCAGGVSCKLVAAASAVNSAATCHALHQWRGPRRNLARAPSHAGGRGSRGRGGGRRQRGGGWEGAEEGDYLSPEELDSIMRKLEDGG